MNLKKMTIEGLESINTKDRRKIRKEIGNAANMLFSDVAENLEEFPGIAQGAMRVDLNGRTYIPHVSMVIGAVCQVEQVR